MLVVCLERIDAADLPVSAVVNFASGLCTCTTIDSLPPRAPNGYRSSRWLILPICSVILCWSSLSIVCNCTRSWSILSSEFMYSTVRRLVADHPWFELLQVFPEVPLVLHLGAHSFVA